MWLVFFGKSSPIQQRECASWISAPPYLHRRNDERIEREECVSMVMEETSLWIFHLLLLRLHLVWLTLLRQLSFELLPFMKLKMWILRTGNRRFVIVSPFSASSALFIHLNHTFLLPFIIYECVAHTFKQTRFSCVQISIWEIAPFCFASEKQFLIVMF